MKTKLIVFLGLILASVTLALTLNTQTAQASGEKYVWTSATTIQASGGKYRGATTFTVTNERRISGSSTELVTNDINIDATYGDCDHTQGRLSLSGNSKTSAMLWMGDLATGTQTSCGSHPASEQSMDATVTIAAQATPPVNYNTVNCKQQYQSADDIAKCESVKKCVITALKDPAQCVSAYDTCIANSNQDDNLTNPEKKACADKVAAGDLPGATAPVVNQDDNKTTCAVQGIGWIICPVASFMSEIVDASYGFVASLLTVQPLLTAADSGTEGVYTAWTVMRNIANVAFVIAFLVIIFSQISSIGITNYGIKKMLPRLVVAAILVNISYWLCAAVIDISNILGVSINQLFVGVKEGLSLPNIEDFGANGGSWTGITQAVLAGGATTIALYVGLSALLPVLISVLFAVVTAFMVLILRQALIILLVVISPLAFVAYLLPNTEDLFKKWRTLFQALLLMYPIVSLIFGASALASVIVMGAAPDGDYKIAVQIGGAAMGGLPLIITPLALKTTSVLGRFAGAINNPNKGPVDRAKKSAEGFRNRQEGRRQIRSLGNGRTMSFGKYSRAAKRNAIASGVESEAKRAQSEYVAEQSLGNEAFRNRMAGGRTLGANASPEALNRAIAGAVSIQARVEAEEVTAASAVIKSLNLDRNQAAMRELAMGGQVGNLDGGKNQAIRAAAMKNVVNSHDVDGVKELLDSVGSMDAKSRESFADSLLESKERPAFVGQSAISDIRQHDGVNVKAKSSDELAKIAIENNTYSVDKLATGDKDELAYIAKIAERADVDNSKITANAEKAKTDARYSGMISKNIDVVDRISKL